MTSNAADSYFRVGYPKPEDAIDESEAKSTTEGISPLTGQTLALLLIELVAPDVMYNGIPWPGEDYIKVTIER